MQIAKLKVKGLTCEGCTCGHCGQPFLIFLRCVKGIDQVVPDFETDTVEVEFNILEISMSELQKISKIRGYEIEEVELDVKNKK